MAVNRTPSRRLAFINASFYLGCVAVGGFLVVPELRDLSTFFREPMSYLPGLPHSMVLAAVQGLITILGALAVGRAFAAERPSRALVGLLYGLTGLLVFLWTTSGRGPQRGTAYPPRAEMVAHLEHLSTALAVSKRLQGRYPKALELLPDAPEGASPWFSHGGRLPLNLVSERGLGARLSGRDGDLAGTIYYVVSPTGDDFWLTAVILDGAPTGDLAFLRDEKGVPMIVSSRSSSVKDETQPIAPSPGVP